MSIIPIIASYLIGSINFAYIVAKFKNINIQEIGSGNPGSSNVMRALGKKYAVIVLTGDLFKGIAPFLIFGSELETLIYASISVIGHCFPIFYGFKGGKGVATYLGTIIGYIVFLAPDLGFLFWEIAIIFGFIVLYFGIFFIFRISAISSLITCSVGALYVIFQSPQTSIVWFQIFILLLIFYQHRANLLRLSKGDENKF
tara:strand:- start:695 stop:1294 length:600 start_codon:yes stop_codon:yes gene_type:complete